MLVVTPGLDLQPLEDGADYVFVLDRSAPSLGAGEAVARRRRVQTRPVPFRPDWVEITSGLEPGGEVAVSAVTQLREGLEIRTQRVAGPARQARPTVAKPTPSAPPAEPAS